MSNLPFAKKALGQHWLHDLATLDAMCEAAEVKSGDAVLEIGPGAGTLTGRLLAHGAQVEAIEFDVSLIPALQKKFQKLSPQQFRVGEGDIRIYDLATMPQPYKIVANIPYYLTANLLRKLVDTAHKPHIAVLLVQKEVAERVGATPGNLSLIAVLVQLFYDVELGELVPAYLFTPPPKVDSQILVMKQKTQSRFPDVDNATFFQLIKAGFSAPRKKLRSSLSGGLHIDKTATEVLLQAANIDPNKRAQELTLDNWHQLYQAFTKNIPLPV